MYSEHLTPPSAPLPAPMAAPSAPQMAPLPAPMAAPSAPQMAPSTTYEKNLKYYNRNYIKKLNTLN